MSHRIDTHAASVFLEGDRALKIKRAVRFPYLDYSTLEKRKAACDEEMTVNRQFAPQIYRRVVPITQDGDGSLSIDGDGTPVEYAIEMTRFDERQTIDHLAEAGELDRRSCRRHCRCDRGLARRRAAGAGRTLDQIDPPLHRGQYRGIPNRSLLCRDDVDDLEGRLNRRFPGFAGCWSNAADRDMYGDAMATCIWRTSS